MAKPLLIISLIFIMMSLNVLVYGVPWYQENFDELKKGPLTPQDGWTNGANASGMVQNKIIHGDKGQSLYIVENSGNQKKFEGGHAGLQYLAFWAYVPQKPEGNLQIYTGSSGGGNNIAFFSRIYNNDRIAAHVGDKQGGVVDTVYTDGTYPYSEWFHVRYVMNFDEKTYGVFINGDLGAEDITFRGGAHEFSWLQMRWDHDEKLEIYIDDIEMGEGLGEDAVNWQGKKAVSRRGKLTEMWGVLKR